MFNLKGNDVTQVSPNKAAAPDRLLRLPEVESMVGLRKSSIYDAMRRGEFPAAVKLSRRAVCWSESSIRDWIQDRINAARASQAGEVRP
jgi:prophage regulatory protein